jgi:hypothetical protein
MTPLIWIYFSILSFWFFNISAVFKHTEIHNFQLLSRMLIIVTHTSLAQINWWVVRWIGGQPGFWSLASSGQQGYGLSSPLFLVISNTWTKVCHGLGGTDSVPYKVYGIQWWNQWLLSSAGYSVAWYIWARPVLLPFLWNGLVCSRRILWSCSVVDPYPLLQWTEVWYHCRSA